MTNNAINRKTATTTPTPIPSYVGEILNPARPTVKSIIKKRNAKATVDCILFLTICSHINQNLPLQLLFLQDFL